MKNIEITTFKEKLLELKVKEIKEVKKELNNLRLVLDDVLNIKYPSIKRKPIGDMRL